MTVVLRLLNKLARACSLRDKLLRGQLDDRVRFNGFEQWWTPAVLVLQSTMDVSEDLACQGLSLEELDRSTACALSLEALYHRGLALTVDLELADSSWSTFFFLAFRVAWPSLLTSISLEKSSASSSAMIQAAESAQWI